MAKRFGRNQRRKMREALAEKQDALENAVIGRVEERRRANELEARLSRWAKDVVQLMGRDSAFNEQVRRMQVSESTLQSGRFRFPTVNIARFSPHPMRMPVASVQTVLEALIWRLHLSREELRPMIRIELENRYAQPVGYALAEDHRWTERDIEYLSRRIAVEMTDLLNRSKR